MLAGREQVSQGSIHVGDRVVPDLARRREIAMVFQNYELYLHMTVAENMVFALKLASKAEQDNPILN